MIEALGEEGNLLKHIDDIQAEKYRLMRLFCDKYKGMSRFPEGYRIVDCFKNASDNIILIRGVGVDGYMYWDFDIKAKHWHELEFNDKYEQMRYGRSSSDLSKCIFLVCEDNHIGENIVDCDVTRFLEKMHARFPFDY